MDCIRCSELFQPIQRCESITRPHALRAAGLLQKVTRHLRSIEDWRRCLLVTSSAVHRKVRRSIESGVLFHFLGLSLLPLPGEDPPLLTLSSLTSSLRSNFSAEEALSREIPRDRNPASSSSAPSRRRRLNAAFFSFLVRAFGTPFLPDNVAVSLFNPFLFCACQWHEGSFLRTSQPIPSERWHERHEVGSACLFCFFFALFLSNPGKPSLLATMFVPGASLSSNNSRGARRLSCVFCSLQRWVCLFFAVAAAILLCALNFSGGRLSLFLSHYLTLSCESGQEAGGSLARN